jgi:hypothetical protein
MTMMFRHFIVLAIAACSANTDPPASNGAVPKISNMVLTPDMVKVGQQTTLQGTLDFEDADGDLKTLVASIKQGGQVSNNSTPVQNLAGQKAGTAALAFALVIPSEGAVEISATLVDTKGNSSNTLTKTIQATK